MTFPTLAIGEVGEYSYTITEIIPETVPNGMHYDTTTYTATFTVSYDSATGILSAGTVSVNGVEGATAEFVNVQDVPATVSIPVSKTLTGRELKAGEFSFVMLMPNGSDFVAKNDAAGNVTFPTLSFSRAGTYVFKILEDVPAVPAADIVYDNSVYEVSVTVTYDTATGKLNAEAPVITKNGSAATAVSFNNVYVAPITLEIPVKKVFNGGTLTAGQFTFKMTGGMKGQSTAMTMQASNNADGTVSFGALTFVEAGTYEFIITEVNGGRVGVIYDAAAYTVTVDVTLDAATGKLNPAITSIVRTAGGQTAPAGEVVFTNEMTKIDIPVTKVWEDGNNVNEFRPKEIYVHLLRDGVDTGMKLTMDAANNWTGVFSGLPVSDGVNAHVYTVYEEPVEEYITTYSGDAANGFVITNHRDVVPEETPETGDAGIGLWIGLVGAAIIGLGVMIILLLKDKKKREE